MASYNYHFRPSTRKGLNKGSIFLRVVHARSSFCISLGLRIYASEWDESARTVIVPHVTSLRHETLKAVRESLDSHSVRLELAIVELDSQGPYALDDIRSRVRALNGSSSLSEFTLSVAGDIHAKQERTARAYKSVLNSVTEFNGGKDVMLSNINGKFVGEYELWLKNRGLHMNTVSFYMRNLRAIFNRAVRANRVGAPMANPFSGIFTGIEKTEKKALDPEQISGLISCDGRFADLKPGIISTLPKRLRDCLALFLFSFFAQGMSFVDLAYLRKENIGTGVIKYRRKKTGQYIEVTVCREMRNIIGYFSDRTKDSPYVFPVIKTAGKPVRLQYESALRIQNIRLGRLAAAAGINQKITTHAARHSWATIAKNEKIEISVISEALGHNNESTTRIYLASFKKKLLDKANERIRRAIKKAV